MFLLKMKGSVVSFQSIPSLTATKLDYTDLVIRVDGPEEAKQELIARLKVFDKSAHFQVLRLRKSIQRMQFILTRDPSDAVQQRLEDAKSMLKEQQQKVHRFLYERSDEGLFIPAGLWSMCGNREGDFHRNTEIQTYFVPGLRDYQKEATREILKYKRAMVVLATGLGKTRIISSICVSAVKAGKRCMVVVPTEYLIGQISGVLSEYHDSVAVASAKKDPKLGSDVLVVTAFSAGKYINSYDVIIIDENHHSSADTWMNLLSHAEQAKHVYAMTATPFREDGLDLLIHAFTGPTVYERDVKWGIRNGWLMNFDVYQIRVEVKDTRGKVIKVSDEALAAVAYKRLVGATYTLNILKQRLMAAIQKDRMCMVLFTNLAQAEVLAKMLRQENCEVRVANANFKKPLNDFREKKTKVLLATSRLVSEGVDIPDVDVLFLVTQHSSRVMTYQSIGRILRKGEKKPIVVDIAVKGFKQYENAAEKRLAIYQDIADSTQIME